MVTRLVWFHTCPACARGLGRFQNAAVGETNVDSLYREMHPNRHCGSHGRSLSVPALQVLRWRYWELRVLFDLPELVVGILCTSCGIGTEEATQTFAMPF